MLMKSAENDGPTKSRPLLQAYGHSTVFSVVTILKFNPNKVIIEIFLNKFFNPFCIRSIELLVVLPIRYFSIALP